MEHRLKNRCKASLSVVVCDHTGSTFEGTTRDISLDGVFIQMAQWDVPESRVVKIGFLPHGYLNGWVAHAGDEGIGVMFLSIGSSERSLLDKLF